MSNAQAATVSSSTAIGSLDEAPKRWHIWTGRVLGALPVAMLGMSAAMKLSHAPGFVEAWTQKMGFRESQLTPIGVLEVVCTLLFVIPRTSILGALLLTGYLGGAVVTHVRVGDPFVIPVVVGTMIWASAYLRNPRVRALLRAS